MGLLGRKKRGFEKCKKKWVGLGGFPPPCFFHFIEMGNLLCLLPPPPRKPQRDEESLGGGCFLLLLLPPPPMKTRQFCGREQEALFSPVAHLLATSPLNFVWRSLFSELVALHSIFPENSAIISKANLVKIVHSQSPSYLHRCAVNPCDAQAERECYIK